MHMLYNSLAIITLGYLEDMSYDYILSKLQTFKGTKRRYTVKTQGNNVFVDDSVIVLFQTPTPALDNSTEIQYNKGCIFRRFP